MIGEMTSLFPCGICDGRRIQQSSFTAECLHNRMINRRKLRKIFWLAVGMSLYPIFVITFTLSHVIKAELPGGRHGPLDAYRHSLASATVSYTIGKWAVDLTSWIFESSKKDSNKMDIHNNRLGAEIGKKVTSFSAIEPAIRQAVSNGKIAATAEDQITWLEPEKWRDGIFW
jgi:hypothetical protein